MLRRATSNEAQGSLGFRVWEGVPHRQPRSHTHIDVEVNFLFGGEVEYFMAGRRQRLGARRFAMLWAGVPHQLVEMSADARFAWITLPIGWVMKWDLGDTLIQRLLGGELVAEPDAQRGELDEALIRQWLADVPNGSAALRRAALTEIQGRVQRLAASAPRKAGPAATVGGADAVQRISGFIASHYSDDLTIADIAGSVGLHPNYAMNAFKEACGMSLWEYVLRLRIGHAQRLLLTSDAKITQIAYDCGFNSASRFYAAFARVCGQSPKEYRRAHAGDVAPA